MACCQGAESGVDILAHIWLIVHESTHGLNILDRSLRHLVDQTSEDVFGMACHSANRVEPDLGCQPDGHGDPKLSYQACYVGGPSQVNMLANPGDTLMF